MIPNPNYKGLWTAPKVSNPLYIGNVLDTNAYDRLYSYRKNTRQPFLLGGQSPIINIFQNSALKDVRVDVVGCKN